MRQSIIRHRQQREAFTAVFTGYSFRKGFKGYPVKVLTFEQVRVKETILQGETMVSAKVRFDANKEFDKFVFRTGDIVSFHATVKEYYKSKREKGALVLSGERAYKLIRPNNISKTQQGTLF